MKNRIEAQRALAWPQQQMEWAGSGASGIRRCYDPSSVAWTRHGNLLLMRGDGADVLTVSLAPSVVASSFVMVAPHVMVRRRAGIRIVEVRSTQLEIERLAMGEAGEFKPVWLNLGRTAAGRESFGAFGYGSRMRMTVEVDRISGFRPNVSLWIGIRLPPVNDYQHRCERKRE